MPIQKGPANLGTGTIETAELASNSVTTAKIADANVTTAKLATTLTVTHALGSASTPSITFTGDTNTGIFSPTADTIAFAEGGTESMRITSAGILAVGTTGPAGDFRMTLAGDDTINPGLVALNNQTGTQVSATLYASSSFGWTGTRSNHPFIILTNGTERLRIPSDAGGITFPATQVASSNANTLDDYEEGTWTTTIGSVANITGTPTLSEGRYTKIGRLVTLEGYFSAQTTSSNTNTYWTFTIPFNTSSNSSGACGSAKQENNFIVGAVSDTTSSSGNSAYVSYSASAQLPSGTATHSFSYTYTAAT
jgi:hypothetical protein